MLPRYMVNGTVSDAVSPGDRGLQYGDGVFETLAVHDGVPVRLDRHLARLTAGCARLGIRAPELAGEVRGFCAEVSRAVLKVVVTRGAGGRGYRPPGGSMQPTRIVSLHAWPEHPPQFAERGVALRWCATRLSRQPALAGLKHLNRLEQVLARAEWEDDDAWQEGLMLDTDGNVVEATQSNLFVVRGGELVTPRVDACGIAGIIRGMVIERFAAAETVLTRDDVASADELFVCNSVIGVWPVRQVEDRHLDAPGATTTRVRDWLATGPE